MVGWYENDRRMISATRRLFDQRNEKQFKSCVWGKSKQQISANRQAGETSRISVYGLALVFLRGLLQKRVAPDNRAKRQK